MRRLWKRLSDKRLAIVFVVVGAVGCASPRAHVGGGEVDVDEPFPDREELSQIESSEQPTSFFNESRTHVESWELQGSLPDRIGAVDYEPSSPFEQILADQVDRAAGDVVASEGMHCLARQVGHFYLEKGAFPSGNLRDFMRTRCGVVAADFGNVWWSWDRPPNASEKRVAEQWKTRGKGVKRLEKAIGGRHRSIGIWYGKNDDRAILLTTFGERTADLEPTAIDVDGDEPIVLEGEGFPDYTRTEAIRTKSAFGFDRCTVDRSVELPEFRVRCEPDGETGPTRVEVLGFFRDRGLGHSVLGNTVWRGESAARTYRPSEASRAVARASRNLGETGEESEREAEAAGDDSEQAGREESGGDGKLEGLRKFVRLVNAVRREAGLSEVSFEAAQSSAANGLAGDYFKAQYESGDAKKADRIALGLLAGWEVEADILSGGLASHAVQAERLDLLAQRLLSTASGRRVLLEPGYTHMAVGLARPSKREAVGAVVTAYRELPDLAHDERATRAFETINELRSQGDEAPIERDSSLDAKIRELANQVEAGTMEFRQAQRQLLAVSSQMWNTRTATVGMLADSLDNFELHPELTGSGPDRAAVMVVPYSSPDLAWTPYIVLVVFPESARQGQMAARPAPDPDREVASRRRAEAGRRP